MKEQLRDVVVAGHPAGETQRVIALRGILPNCRVDGADDLEGLSPMHFTHDIQFEWIGRQIARAHVKATIEAGSKGQGPE